MIKQRRHIGDSEILTETRTVVGRFTTPVTAHVPPDHSEAVAKFIDLASLHTGSRAESMGPQNYGARVARLSVVFKK
jgi:hypothetical protein